MHLLKGYFVNEECLVRWWCLVAFQMKFTFFIHTWRKMNHMIDWWFRSPTIFFLLSLFSLVLHFKRNRLHLATFSSEKRTLHLIAHLDRSFWLTNLQWASGICDTFKWILTPLKTNSEEALDCRVRWTDAANGHVAIDPNDLRQYCMPIIYIYW